MDLYVLIAIVSLTSVKIFDATIGLLPLDLSHGNERSDRALF